MSKGNGEDGSVFLHTGPSVRAVCPVHGDLGDYHVGSENSASLLIFNLSSDTTVAFCPKCVCKLLEAKISPIRITEP